RAQAVRARRIEMSKDAAGVVVKADPGLLQRVIDNIVDNAKRHTPNGGKIRLEARREGASVTIHISNNGPPIPPEARARVFEKFGQAGKGPRNTFGLGLYFSRLVLEAHGGRISVVSTDDWPTSFV